MANHNHKELVPELIRQDLGKDENSRSLGLVCANQQSVPPADENPRPLRRLTTIFGCIPGSRDELLAIIRALHISCHPGRGGLGSDKCLTNEIKQIACSI